MHEISRLTRSTSFTRPIGAATLATALVAGSLLAASPAFAAGPLSGTVLDAGVPVANVDVGIDKQSATNGSWSEVDDGTTDGAGAWASTDPLTDGNYALFFDVSDSSAIYSADQTSTGADSLHISTQFTVTGGVPSQSSFTTTLVRNAGAISLTQRSSADGSLVTGGSATAGTSYGVDKDGNVVIGNSVSEPTSDGTLLLGHLPAATYFPVETGADGYSSDYLDAVTTTAGVTLSVTSALHPTADPLVSTLLSSPVTTVTGAPKIGTLLTVTDPSASSPVTFSHQWATASGYYGGPLPLPVVGATSPTFVPTSKQLGQLVFAYAIARKDGYAPAIIYPAAPGGFTPAIKIGDPNPITVTVTGTTKFGHALAATVAGSTLSDAKSSYQWYRNGAPIGGADGSHYTLTKADVGQKVFASVTSFAQGHTDAVIPSNTVSVAHEKATVSVKAPKSISKKTKLTVKVTLKDGASKNAATGKVKVFYSSKKFKTVTFTSKSTSKTVILPKLAKGKHTIKISYAGDTHYSSKSTSFKVTVK
ncbi:hypothetical protein BH11ACT2_BH11ACT2_02820 [soil metagenome]